MAAVVLALLPAPAVAQIVVGQATAVDGDTLLLGETYIRLHGIDAVEADQTCTRNGEEWACGADAEARLAHFIDGNSVRCEQRDIDSYGRMVATCLVNRQDLSLRMVEEGLAIALPQYSTAYVEAADRAQSFSIGIWASEFEAPAHYRSENPQAALPPPRQREPFEFVAPRAMAPSRPSAISTYYPNCDAARAAGAAPMNYGEPGFREQLDADGDGVACEPYRGR